MLVRFLGAGSREMFAWAAAASVFRFEERAEWAEARLAKKSLRPKFAKAVAEAKAMHGGAAVLPLDA